MKTVMVDRKNCIGCQNCTRVCPKIFQMAEGASMPDNEFLDITTDSELVDRAIAECPVSVISWRDSEKPAVSEKIKKESKLGFFQRFFSKNEKTDFALIAHKKLTEEVMVFTFEKPKKDFFPGQFFTLSLSDAEGEFSRSYSVFSASEKEISFCIHLTPTGRGAAALRQMSIGNCIKITGPFGKFTLAETSCPKFFIATGTGVAPIFSMLPTIPNAVSATLFFGVRNETDLFLVDEFRNMSGIRVVFALSGAEKTEGDFFAGRVTDILKTEEFPADAEFYLCGNPKMVEEGNTILLNRGVEKSKIFFEHFS